MFHKHPNTLSKFTFRTKYVIKATESRIISFNKIVQVPSLKNFKQLDRGMRNFRFPNVVAHAANGHLSQGGGAGAGTGSPVDQLVQTLGRKNRATREHPIFL